MSTVSFSFQIGFVTVSPKASYKRFPPWRTAESFCVPERCTAPYRRLSKNNGSRYTARTPIRAKKGISYHQGRRNGFPCRKSPFGGAFTKRGADGWNKSVEVSGILTPARQENMNIRLILVTGFSASAMIIWNWCRKWILNIWASSVFGFFFEEKSQTNRLRCTAMWNQSLHTIKKLRRTFNQACRSASGRSYDADRGNCSHAHRHLPLPYDFGLRGRLKWYLSAKTASGTFRLLSYKMWNSLYSRFRYSSSSAARFSSCSRCCSNKTPISLL